MAKIEVVIDGDRFPAVTDHSVEVGGGPARAGAIHLGCHAVCPHRRAPQPGSDGRRPPT